MKKVKFEDQTQGEHSKFASRKDISFGLWELIVFQEISVLNREELQL